MYKTFGLQVRRAGLSHEQYVHHWLTVHAPMSAAVDALQGYVANEVLRAGSLPGLTVSHPQFALNVDGVAQLHVSTQDGVARLAELPQVQSWFADGPNYVGFRTGFMAEEHVLQSPGKEGRLPFKAICFLQGAFEPLHAALRSDRAASRAGLVCSRVDAVTGSTNLPNFEVPQITALLELWGADLDQALDHAIAWQRQLAGNVRWVGALLAREIVIRMPAQSPES